ncbi:MAG: 50S ribosomal protein L4 [Pseudomonadota bacterium]
MKAKVVTLDNKAAGEIDLSAAIFGAEDRPDILARMVRYQLAKRRAGTHKTKTRSEITATGAKMFRQKGTGRARRGDSKIGVMRGGGRAFGPVVRDHGHSLNKKLRKLALRVALSVKLRAGSLIILDDAKIAKPKTADLTKKLDKLGVQNALVLCGDQLDSNFVRAARNIPNVDVLVSAGANVYDILRRSTLVVTRDCVTNLEARLK